MSSLSHQCLSWWGGPLAVLAAAAALLALGALFQSTRPAKNVEQSYSTAPGEQRAFTLSTAILFDGGRRSYDDAR